MSRTTVAFLVAALVAVPAVLLGKALGAGDLAWLGLLVALMVLASAIDRDGFYGPRRRAGARRARPQSR